MTEPAPVSVTVHANPRQMGRGRALSAQAAAILKVYGDVLGDFPSLADPRHANAYSPLWDAQVPMTDSAGGAPYVTMAVPGRDFGLQLLLGRDAEGRGEVLILPYRIVGTNPDGTPIPQNVAPVSLLRGETRVSDELGVSLELADFGEYTLLIAKNDPGQGIVWIAFAALITGIAITFYLPRRRIWARFAPNGAVGLVWQSDRYVDVEREFGRLLDDLVAARRPG